MYNVRKAAQSIAYLASLSGGTINILKVVKLVYLSDRESISRFGYPIQDGDYYVSMPNGPVNSLTLSYLNGDKKSGAWDCFLCDRENHNVAVKGGISTDDLDELSEADLECLLSTWQRFKQMNGFEVADWTHKKDNIPEWEDPRGSSVKIDFREILEALEMQDIEVLETRYEDSIRLGAIFERISAI